MTRPKNSYFVCFTPRSGSTMFCEALYNTGVAGHPEEYFDPRPRGTVRDSVWQAISVYRARLTDAWTSRADVASREPDELAFNFKIIDSLLHSIVSQEAAWAELFTQAGIAPLTVTYEDLVLDYAPTVWRTLAYLGIEPPRDLELPAPQLDKQADALSEEWLSLYYRCHRRHHVWNTALNVPLVMLQSSLRRQYLYPDLHRWARTCVAFLQRGEWHKTLRKDHCRIHGRIAPEAYDKASLQLGPEVLRSLKQDTRPLSDCRDQMDPAVSTRTGHLRKGSR